MPVPEPPPARPRYQEAEAEPPARAELRDALIDPYINPSYEILQQQVTAARSRAAQLERKRAEMLKARSSNGQLPALADFYTRKARQNELEMQQRLAEKIYLDVATRFEQARLQIAARSAQLQLLDAALPPDWKVYPREKLMASAALVLAFSLLTAGVLAVTGISERARSGSARRAMTTRGWYVHGLKPAADRVAAAVLLLATSPVLGAAALLVRLHFGAPVLFVQERPGLHGRPFRLRKLRTMHHAHDPQGRLLPDAARLTPHRALAAGGERRRAAAAGERAAGRDEPGRAAAAAARLSGSLLAAAGAAPRGPARPDRLGPGARPQRRGLGASGSSWTCGTSSTSGRSSTCGSWALTALRLLRPSGIAYAGHATMPEFQGTSEPDAGARDGAAAPGRGA